jgi:outer membrane autotransporter protein
MGQGIHNLLASAKRRDVGLVPFGAVSGGSSRYDTGSHVDVDGFSLLAGLGWRLPVNPQAGSLLLGAFFEGGRGSYDSYNSFNNMASVKGDGDTSYYGGGILGRYEKQAGPGGVYGEASVRAGRTDTDFRSKDILNAMGGDVTYDSDSTYYGAHLGAGYIWNITAKASLDFSGKYIWTHQTDDSVVILGDLIEFKSINSHRVRLGGRFAYAVNGFVTPYGGLYYDHEFGGKAKATANGAPIKAPELDGGTGIGEIGLTLTPSKGLPLSFDFGVQGYVGEREGVTGSIQAKYEF